jgi:hypothetical protein
VRLIVFGIQQTAEQSGQSIVREVDDVGKQLGDAPEQGRFVVGHGVAIGRFVGRLIGSGAKPCRGGQAAGQAEH